MNTLPAVSIDKLSHRYGERIALDSVTLTIEAGEAFAFLGPNGGGKTTLFRLLSTLLIPPAGHVGVFGQDPARNAFEVRNALGVVFQAPSVDKKLTVAENLAQQAALYGVRGKEFLTRRQDVCQQLGLEDRLHERVETLSGGLRRRLDLAKALLHRPRLLLLDEPSTGLDPGARSDLWRYLRRLRQEFGMTIVLTTHLLEEADRADRIGILHRGRLIGAGSPAAMRAECGVNSLRIVAVAPDEFAAILRQRYACSPLLVEHELRVTNWSPPHGIEGLLREFPKEIQTITVGPPTLEDVFIRATGHHFWEDAQDSSPSSPTIRAH